MLARKNELQKEQICTECVRNKYIILNTRNCPGFCLRIISIEHTGQHAGAVHHRRDISVVAPYVRLPEVVKCSRTLCPLFGHVRRQLHSNGGTNNRFANEKKHAHMALGRKRAHNVYFEYSLIYLRLLYVYSPKLAEGKSVSYAHVEIPARIEPV